jgi:hypothetical protein
MLRRSAFSGEAMGAIGDPEKVAMDKSGANKAAIEAINAGRDVPIVVRQVIYLNSIVEQDHRAVKRMTRPMFNFKSLRGAASVLAGGELMHMIRKVQFAIDGADAMSFADQFYALAGQVRPVLRHCSSSPGKFRLRFANPTEQKFLGEPSIAPLSATPRAVSEIHTVYSPNVLE